MPKLNRSVPSYRKHRASGQAIVTLGGKDHYLGPHGTRTSRREYDRMVSEWLAAGRIKHPSQADSLTMVELIAVYWKHARKHYVKNGKRTDEQYGIKSALRHVKALYLNTPACEFGPLALKAVRQRMIDDDLARSTINSHVLRIRRMIRWAVGEELLPSSQYQGLLAVTGIRLGSGDAREAPPVLSVDAAVVDATLEHLPEVVADMVRLQRLSGMRPAELCLLRPADLDRSGEVWTYEPSSHKTEHHGRSRVVFLGPRAQAVLLRYLARDTSACCFRPIDSEAKRLAIQHAERKTPLSCGDRPGTNRKSRPKRRAGEQYSVDSYRRAIHRACDKAGVERWSPNRLRHSTATEVRAKFGLEAAQVVLGHAGAAVTQLYAERDLAKGVEVARQIG